MQEQHQKALQEVRDALERQLNATKSTLEKQLQTAKNEHQREMDRIQQELRIERKVAERRTEEASQHLVPNTLSSAHSNVD